MSDTNDEQNNDEQTKVNENWTNDQVRRMHEATAKELERRNGTPESQVALAKKVDGMTDSEYRDYKSQLNHESAWEEQQRSLYGDEKPEKSEEQAERDKWHKKVAAMSDGEYQAYRHKVRAGVE